MRLQLLSAVLCIAENNTEISRAHTALSEVSDTFQMGVVHAARIGTYLSPSPDFSNCPVCTWGVTYRTSLIGRYWLGISSTLSTSVNRTYDI